MSRTQGHVRRGDHLAGAVVDRYGDRAQAVLPLLVEEGVALFPYPLEQLPDGGRRRFPVRQQHVAQ
jgi:hypothetical protein